MKDNKFKQILEDKEIVQLPKDFNDNMMSIIREHSKKRADNKKEIKLMYMFFIFVLIFGLLITNILLDKNSYILSNNIEVNNLILAPFVIIILYLFEKVYRATLISFGKEKFSIL